MVEPTTRSDPIVMGSGMVTMAIMVIIILKVVTMVKGVLRIETDNLEETLTKIRGNVTGVRAGDTSDPNATVI